MQDLSRVCNLHHSSRQRRILTHWARPGIKPATSWFLVGFVNHCATAGTPELPMLHWIKVVRVGILVLFRILAGRLSAFLLWVLYICCGFVINGFYYVKVCSPLYPLWTLKYTSNLYNSTAKKPITQLKDKQKTQTFLQERYTDCQQAHEKMLHITDY